MGGWVGRGKSGEREMGGVGREVGGEEMGGWGGERGVANNVLVGGGVRVRVRVQRKIKGKSKALLSL